MTTITPHLGHGMGNDWENKDWVHITVPEITPPRNLIIHVCKGVFRFCGVVHAHFLRQCWLKSCRL